jgi:hypothetical protein
VRICAVFAEHNRYHHLTANLGNIWFVHIQAIYGLFTSEAHRNMFYTVSRGKMCVVWRAKFCYSFIYFVFRQSIQG